MNSRYSKITREQADKNTAKRDAVKQELIDKMFSSKMNSHTDSATTNSEQQLNLEEFDQLLHEIEEYTDDRGTTWYK